MGRKGDRLTEVTNLVQVLPMGRKKSKMCSDMPEHQGTRYVWVAASAGGQGRAGPESWAEAKGWSH